MNVKKVFLTKKYNIVEYYRSTTSRSGTRAIHGPESDILTGEKMIKLKPMKNGPWLSIIVREKTKVRLRNTCFRGQKLKLAGNFFKWPNVEMLFEDELVVQQLLDCLKDAIKENAYGTTSIVIEYDAPVGWESTGSINLYPPEVLEEFEPNRKSRALKVKTDRTDILAPLTNKLTVIVEFKPEDGKPAAVIHSVYPGEDIGELRGDVTHREQRVFFDWNHPGA